MPAILSPCAKICTIDPGSEFCSGCGRSLAEIESWMAYSDAERTRIMQELPGRLRAMRLPHEPSPATQS